MIDVLFVLGYRITYVVSLVGFYFLGTCKVVREIKDVANNIDDSVQLPWAVFGTCARILLVGVYFFFNKD